MIEISNVSIPNPTPQPSLNSGQTEQVKTDARPKKRLPIFISCLLLVLCVVLISVLTINYFNVFSLSQKYPDTFDFLPHQPFPNQKTINSEALYNVPKEGENWAILAEFFKVENNTVFIKYDDKIPSLQLTKDIQCKQAGEEVPTKTGFQTTIVGIPCSDVITNKNKGKKVVVDYNLDDLGNFIIKQIELE